MFLVICFWLNFKNNQELHPREGFNIIEDNNGIEKLQLQVFQKGADRIQSADSETFWKVFRGINGFPWEGEIE